MINLNLIESLHRVPADKVTLGAQIIRLLKEKNMTIEELSVRVEQPVEKLQSCVNSYWAYVMVKKNLISVTNPNGWSCLPASFALVLGLPLPELLLQLGHDGSEIIWPDLEEPYCRRGFHIQEMIKICIRENCCVTPIEPRPMSSVNSRLLSLDVWPNFEKEILFRIGVFTGELSDGRRHAVVWNGESIVDVSNILKSSNDYLIECFWWVQKVAIKSF